MKTIPVQVLLLSAAISMGSCKKEKTVSRNTTMLTQLSWQYDRRGIDENLDGEIDIAGSFEDCALDDQVKFNANGNGTFNQGTDLCYPGFPQIQSFDWQFVNNETQIQYGGALHTILQLSQNEFSIYTEEENGSETIRHILVYTR